MIMMMLMMLMMTMIKKINSSSGKISRAFSCIVHAKLWSSAHGCRQEKVGKRVKKKKKVTGEVR